MFEEDAALEPGEGGTWNQSHSQCGVVWGLLSVGSPVNGWLGSGLLKILPGDACYPGQLLTASLLSLLKGS